jgi:intracellular septation protein
MKKSHNSLAKFCYDFLPLIIFFGFYKFSNSPNPLIIATICMMIATFVALIFSYILTKTIPTVALVSGILLGVFGGLTILLKDEIFIKMKPTIVNLIFAAILFYGYFSKKPLISYIMGDQIKMSLQAWLVLSLRWAFFFLSLAVLNEVIWRFFSTDFWVKFKVFGMMPLSLIFTVSQLPFIIKQMKDFEKSAK